MKSLHKMLVHVINTLELCEHKNDRQQCYDLITDLIKQLHDYDNCIEEGECVASVPEHFLLHSITTALQTGTFKKGLIKKNSLKTNNDENNNINATPKTLRTKTTPSFIDKYEHGVTMFFGNSLS